MQTTYIDIMADPLAPRVTCAEDEYENPPTPCDPEVSSKDGSDDNEEELEDIEDDKMLRADTEDEESSDDDEDANEVDDDTANFLDMGMQEYTKNHVITPDAHMNVNAYLGFTAEENTPYGKSKAGVCDELFKQKLHIMIEKGHKYAKYAKHALKVIQESNVPLSYRLETNVEYPENLTKYTRDALERKFGKTTPWPTLKSLTSAYCRRIFNNGEVKLNSFNPKLRIDVQLIDRMIDMYMSKKIKPTKHAPKRKPKTDGSPAVKKAKKSIQRSATPTTR